MTDAPKPTHIAEAVRLIHSACQRLGNDNLTAANTPERKRFVETLELLWDAAGILDPDHCHPEDAARYHERRAALSAASTGVDDAG